MLDKGLFRRLDCGGWCIPAQTFGVEIIVNEELGRPCEAAVRVAECIVENLGAVEAHAVDYMRRHFKMSGRYRLLYVEVSGVPDEYGAMASVCFFNDDDFGMSIDVGLKISGPADAVRPCYAVIHY